jgi:hypothetical protein
MLPVEKQPKEQLDPQARAIRAAEIDRMAEDAKARVRALGDGYREELAQRVAQRDAQRDAAFAATDRLLSARQADAAMRETV